MEDNISDLLQYDDTFGLRDDEPAIPYSDRTDTIRPFGTLTAGEVLSSRVSLTELPQQKPRKQKQRAGSKDSVDSPTPMTTAPAGSDAEGARPKRSSVRVRNSPASGTAASAGSQTMGVTTLPRRPSKNADKGATASSIPSKRVSSDSLASDYNKRRSMNRSNEDLSLAAAETEQTVQVSETNVYELPLATETPSFDDHVKLQDPATQDLEQPVFCEMDQKLDASMKANLKEWFEMLLDRDPKEFRPWWNRGRQRDTKCLGCKTQTHRDSRWNGRLTACDTCKATRRPCMRLVLVLRDQKWFHDVRVLPQGEDNPFGYWSAVPTST